jgi:geranylgeranyl diphosphate synthase type I
VGEPQLDEATVMRLREVIVRSGALAATEARIEALSGAALAALDTVELADDAGTVLRELAEVTAYRNT